MSLFHVSSRGLVPFRRLDSAETGGDATSALTSVISQDLSAVTGERLLSIANGVRQGGERNPALVALDEDGGLVIVYVRQSLDKNALGEALECVSWARRVTVSELAEIHPGGDDAFWDSWTRFAGTSGPPALRSAPKLVLVARELTAQTAGVLSFLAEFHIPVAVLRIELLHNDDGERLLQVHRARVSSGESIEREPSSRRPERLDDAPSMPLDSAQRIVLNGAPKPVLTGTREEEIASGPSPVHARQIAEQVHSELDPLKAPLDDVMSHENHPTGRTDAGVNDIAFAPTTRRPAASADAGVRLNGHESHRPVPRSVNPLEDTLVRMATANGAKLTGIPAAPRNSDVEPPSPQAREEKVPRPGASGSGKPMNGVSHVGNSDAESARHAESRQADPDSIMDAIEFAPPGHDGPGASPVPRRRATHAANGISVNGERQHSQSPRDDRSQPSREDVNDLEMPPTLNWE